MIETAEPLRRSLIHTTGKATPANPTVPHVILIAPKPIWPIILTLPYISKRNTHARDKGEKGNSRECQLGS
jgi:hypothetical protein